MSTRIREFRKLRGMTLSYLAQQVGTTAQTIQRLETGNMTVSLDWLHRIADVFGLPAAALLVTDTTASVPILGAVGSDGVVLPVSDPTVSTTLSIVVSSPSPVAVRVAAAVDGFDPDTFLVANKTEFDPELLLENARCLFALASGRTLFRTVNSNGNGLDCLRGAEHELFDAADIGWVAPLTMAIRYF
jgi:transcriptional regulator with XRE-family HTH domain